MTKYLVRHKVRPIGSLGPFRELADVVEVEDVTENSDIPIGPITSFRKKNKGHWEFGDPISAEEVIETENPSV